MSFEDALENEEEETYVERIYIDFKTRCRAIAEGHATDYFLVHGLVTFSFLTLREAGSGERSDID